MSVDRIAGVLLVLVGIVGFVTVADDLRHVGEFIGVASLLLSGVILLVGGFTCRPLKFFWPRWMALGTLSGMVVGAGLDNMVLGVAIGFTAGTLVGFARSRG